MLIFDISLNLYIISVLVNIECSVIFLFVSQSLSNFRRAQLAREISRIYPSREILCVTLRDDAN